MTSLLSAVVKSRRTSGENSRMVGLRLAMDAERKLAALMLATGSSASALARQLLEAALAQNVTPGHLEALAKFEAKQGGAPVADAPKRRGRKPKELAVVA
jgi:hypothetical protein